MTITREEGLAALAAWWDAHAKRYPQMHDESTVLVDLMGGPGRHKDVSVGQMRAAFAPIDADALMDMQRYCHNYCCGCDDEDDDGEWYKVVDVQNRFENLRGENAKLMEKVEALDMQILELDVKLNDAQRQIEDVYTQRNTLAIAFADLATKLGWPAGWGTDELSEGWDKSWKRVVYVQLPSGKQLSWHMNPATEAWAHSVLRKYDGQWDGTFHGREAPDWLGLLPAFALDAATLEDQVRNLTIKATSFSKLPHSATDDIRDDAVKNTMKWIRDEIRDATVNAERKLARSIMKTFGLQPTMPPDDEKDVDAMIKLARRVNMSRGDFAQIVVDNSVCSDDGDECGYVFVYEKNITKIYEAMRSFGDKSVDQNMLTEEAAKVAKEHIAKMSAIPPDQHDLYKTADQDRPSSICDDNAQVVLSLCKKCGRAEVELAQACNVPLPHQYQIREIGESDWAPVTYQRYLNACLAPEMDTRVVDGVVPK